MATASRSTNPKKGQKSSNIIPLDSASPPTPQLLTVAKFGEINGIRMGVLTNDVPFLTESGLAEMCGISGGELEDLAANWDVHRQTPRGRIIDLRMRTAGYTGTKLSTQCHHRGHEFAAYPEMVCMALLEHYAFEIPEPKSQAQFNFRQLAREKFRDYVYRGVGFKPKSPERDCWTHFYDRVDLTENAVPDGYFCIFRELAPVIVPMMRNGVDVNDTVMPDISAGIEWAKYWKANALEQQFGARIPYPHNYPPYYAQCKSNPQPANAYPDAALGTFRKWLRETYLPTKYPAYITGQIRKGTVSANAGTMAVLALTCGSKNSPVIRNT